MKDLEDVGVVHVTFFLWNLTFYPEIELTLVNQCTVFRWKWFVTFSNYKQRKTKRYD